MLNGKYFAIGLMYIYFMRVMLSMKKKLNFQNEIIEKGKIKNEVFEKKLLFKNSKSYFQNWR